MAVFQALRSIPLSSIPVFEALKTKQPEMYRALESLQKEMRRVQKQKVDRVSLICSTAIPPWSQVKNALEESVNSRLDLASAFHSPAYGISFLEELISDLVYGRTLSPETFQLQCQMLKEQLDNLFSFNNPLHLPFTQDRSNLSHELMGQVTNRAGDACIRFGLGVGEQSLEVREYTFGKNRQFTDINGLMAYEVRHYPQSRRFEGEYNSFFIRPGDELWLRIQRDGLLKAIHQYITTL
jgi:hypothetical protein